MTDSKISKILDYVPQPDARTCQSACCAKVIGSNDVPAVRAELEQMGIPGDPYVMGRFLRPRVAEYDYHENASINEMIGWLKQGYTIITHGYFTSSGHVICLIDHDDSRGTFIVDDPWGEFDAALNWRYGSNEYGNDLHYSDRCIYAACVKGTSRDDAEYVYQLGGAIDKDLKNAYCHKIKN